MFVSVLHCFLLAVVSRFELCPDVHPATPPLFVFSTHHVNCVFFFFCLLVASLCLSFSRLCGAIVFPLFPVSRYVVFLHFFFMRARSSKRSTPYSLSVVYLRVRACAQSSVRKLGQDYRRRTSKTCTYVRKGNSNANKKGSVMAHSFHVLLLLPLCLCGSYDGERAVK